MSKDLQLAWPDELPEMAIYAILCKPTGQVYVGQSRRLRGRWRDHLHDLHQGRSSEKLQKAWDDHGPLGFDWVVLEEVSDLRALCEREQTYIDLFNSAVDGLNVCPKVGSFEGLILTEFSRSRIGLATRKRLQNSEYRERLAQSLKEGRARSCYHYTKQHRERLSLSQKGVPRGPMPEQQKEKISKANKGRTPFAAIQANLGKHRSEETKKKIREVKQGKTWSEEQRARIRGRKNSAEHCQNMSKARKGVPWSGARWAAQAKRKAEVNHES